MYGQCYTPCPSTGGQFVACASGFGPFQRTPVGMPQDSLGGTARTVVLITCSLAEADLSETHSSLRFAVRAKKIRCIPCRGSLTARHSPLATHRSPLTARHSPLTTHRSQAAHRLPFTASRSVALPDLRCPTLGPTLCHCLARNTPAINSAESAADKEMKRANDKLRSELVAARGIVTQLGSALGGGEAQVTHKTQNHRQHSTHRQHWPRGDP